MGEAILIGNVSKFGSEMKIAYEWINITVTKFRPAVSYDIFLFKKFRLFLYIDSCTVERNNTERSPV